MMLSRLRRAMLEIGSDVNPETLNRSEELWANEFGVLFSRPVTVLRDLSYGLHQRHSLDLYQPASRDDNPAPIILFVPGGGFSGGGKNREGFPYYDNIGRWAAQQGWAGLCMNYRLSPAFKWPSGQEDVARAVQWVQQNAQAYRLDAKRIVLMGHSAGAAHAAGYIASHHKLSSDFPGVRAGVLLSGIYDVPLMATRPSVLSYFGGVPEQQRLCSSTEGLAKSTVPLFIAVANREPSGFHAQAMALLSRFQDERGQLPEFIVVPEHNHYTLALHIGSGQGAFESMLSEFIERHIINE